MLDNCTYTPLNFDSSIFQCQGMFVKMYANPNEATYNEKISFKKKRFVKTVAFAGLTESFPVVRWQLMTLCDFLLYNQVSLTTQYCTSLTQSNK